MFVDILYDDTEPTVRNGVSCYADVKRGVFVGNPRVHSLDTIPADFNGGPELTLKGGEMVVVVTDTPIEVAIARTGNTPTSVMPVRVSNNGTTAYRFVAPSGPNTDVYVRTL